mgnify:CR=1 FL=1
MARTVSIGTQDFEKMIQRNCFYVDKTGFIKEWWESEDEVTLITRPRRFGKTLNMSMLNCFFSNKYLFSKLENSSINIFYSFSLLLKYSITGSIVTQISHIDFAFSLIFLASSCASLFKYNSS